MRGGRRKGKRMTKKGRVDRENEGLIWEEGCMLRVNDNIHP